LIDAACLNCDRHGARMWKFPEGGVAFAPS